jgi:hypothetical protein
MLFWKNEKDWRKNQDSIGAILLTNPSDRVRCALIFVNESISTDLDQMSPSPGALRLSWSSTFRFPNDSLPADLAQASP